MDSFNAMEPANPKVLTPYTKLKMLKSPRSFSIFHQGLIGWGTLTFRYANLHAKYQKSTIQVPIQTNIVSIFMKNTNNFTKADQNAACGPSFS